MEQRVLMACQGLMQLWRVVQVIQVRTELLMRLQADRVKLVVMRRMV